MALLEEPADPLYHLVNTNSAFESGGLPETKESERKEVLVAPTAEVMSNAEQAIRDALLNGTPSQRKACSKSWWSR